MPNAIVHAMLSVRPDQLEKDAEKNMTGKRGRLLLVSLLVSLVPCVWNKSVAFVCMCVCV